MSEETLLSAARRVVRFFNIDNTQGGGLISIETQQAMTTLDIQITQENRRQQELAKAIADHLPKLVP
jgi:hypothetical protein